MGTVGWGGALIKRGEVVCGLRLDAAVYINFSVMGVEVQSCSTPPFGLPVVPLVYTSTAPSSILWSIVSNWPSSACSASVWPTLDADRALKNCAVCAELAWELL